MTTQPHGFGVGLPHQNAEHDPNHYQHALAILRPPCWHNWKYDQSAYIYPHYLPAVYAMKIDNYAQAAIPLTRNGQRLWLLGNEPEPDRKQSMVTPKEAAEFSRWWHDNASGEWAAPGVLLGLRAAYDWLDEYLAERGEIPHVWHVHNYAWTPRTFDAQLFEFDHWMRSKNIVRPIIISECASWDQTLPAQIAVMDRVRVALDAGNIIAAMWYSARTYPGGPLGHADLLAVDGTLTDVGEAYRSARPELQPPPKPQVYLPIVIG